ncbi:Ldh family oxidoreductase [Aspergillus thermomutatus]|uniref:Malate/L-lactate dehydrogenase n=1 Tax=Aspergillus thermomutatus TaxID=41047 RepID=A0A397H3Y2_ASPTH|nr:uncharacterized protein CDV56_103756 [Aspergillus thermomutatus]RHZ56578.1 hypothetical protein CDV56_103756 [Aspergillus thermomutatus]
MPVARNLFVQANNLKHFIQSVLTGHGVPSPSARIVSDCLALADLRGIDTHGINRLPSYLDQIKAGVLDPKAKPTVAQVTPVVAQVDCHNGLAYVAATQGIERAIDMANSYGIGLVSVKHSSHLGMSAWVVQKALDAGMMSMVLTNASPTVPVWGGSVKLMGTSPIACGAPGGREKPFLMDMATTVATKGRILKAPRNGEEIPDTWALDRKGNPTTDPEEALKGGLRPIGDHKGSALAILMDLFAGVFTGSAFAGQVGSPDDVSKFSDIGHLFIVLKPDLFMPWEEYCKRADHLYRTVVDSEPLDGVERIYYPGEREQLTYEERLRSGVPLTRMDIDKLNTYADAVGVERLVVSKRRE